MRIVIIGAGPCGIGAVHRINELLADELKEQKQEISVLVLEKESFPGGLSCTVTDDNGFLWDMGGHITFCTANFPYYQEAIRKSIDQWNDLTRNCQVDMNYLFNKTGIHLVPYPAQYAIPLFPEKIKQQSLAEMKQLNDNPIKDIPHTFKDWILMNLGSTIHEIFFKPYTKKVWTVKTTEMNPNWVGTRVAKIDQTKLEELCTMDQSQLKTADFGWGPNAVFSFPKYGGTGAIWKKIADKMPADWFSFNKNVIGIDPKKKLVTYVDTTEQLVQECQTDYDVLINTMPMDVLGKCTNLCPDIDIKHNKVIVVGVGVRLPKPQWVESFTWLYFPDPNVPFYRVTFFSRYGHVTPDPSVYWSVLCESARSIDDQMPEEEIKEWTIRGLQIKSIIEQRSDIVSIYSITLPYGYPIPSVHRDSELARAHSILEEHRIYSRGRFGGWKYETSNQDHCFMQGKELIDRLLFGHEEVVYKTGLVKKQG